MNSEWMSTIDRSMRESAGERCITRIHTGEHSMDVLTNTSPRYPGELEYAERAAYDSFLRNSTGAMVLTLTGDSYGG